MTEIRKSAFINPCWQRPSRKQPCTTPCTLCGLIIVRPGQTRHDMDIFEHTLIKVALMLGIIWPAVFVLVFLDRLRGSSMSFFGGGRYHLPKIWRPLSWQRHLIRLPYYCVCIPAFALCCLFIFPPLYMVELGTKLLARISGRAAKKAEK